MTNFPASLDDYNTLLYPFTRYKWVSSLKSAITANQTIITLTDSSNIPSLLVGNYVGVEDEIMLVQSIDNSGSDKKITVVRGQDDSTAAEHASNIEVVQCYSAVYHRRLVECLLAIENFILSGIVPPSIDLTINATPFTYTYSSVKGDIYNLSIAVKNTDASKKAIRNYVVHHFNDDTKLPIIIDSSMSGDMEDIVIDITNITTTGFDVSITGANGGSAKISKSIIGKGV